MKELEINLGYGATNFAQQLAKHGLRVQRGSLHCFDRDRVAINTLVVRGYVTAKQAASARKKLSQRITAELARQANQQEPPQCSQVTSSNARPTGCASRERGREQARLPHVPA